ncbi:hypothetical protein ACF3NG_08035 [Aerococcaceae bacterium WGS1372]
MSLATITNELWRFFKDNLLRIIIGSVLISVITVGARYFITDFIFFDRHEAVAYLETVYSKEPSSFKAVVTIEDGQIFSNAHLFDDYFSSPEVVEYIESETGLEFQQTFDSEHTLELYKSPSFRGAISGIRDNASGTFIFRILAGQTAEENLKIAEAYRDLLESGEIQFMSNQQADIIVEPFIGEIVDTEEYLSVPTIDTLSVYRSNNARSLFVYSVLGFIVGLILMTAIYFLLRLRKPKINYAFEYVWDLNDQHLLVNSTKENASMTLQDAISIPMLKSRWIVAQNPILTSDDGSMSEDNEQFISNLHDVSHDMKSPQQIVLVIQSNHTDKQWLKDQMSMAKLYNVPIKIVHNY